MHARLNRHKSWKHTHSVLGYLGQVSMEEKGKKRTRHMWKRDKGGTDCSTDREEGSGLLKEGKREKKIQTEEERVSDRWEERGRKWDKGHHSVTCRLWKQFTLLEWAEGGRIQRRETGSKRNQFNTTEIHKHFHLIKALQDESRTERERMRPTRSGQYCGRTPSQGRAFCLKTFHPLPLSPSDSLTLILTVGS